jgi:hypothetical protein
MLRSQTRKTPISLDPVRIRQAMGPDWEGSMPYQKDNLGRCAAGERGERGSQMGTVMLLTIGMGNSSPIISAGLRKTPQGVKRCVDRHSRLSSAVRLSVVVKKFKV